MLTAKLHDQLGDKALHVMALASTDGWLYLAEVIEDRAGAELRTRAVNYTPLDSAMSALAQGMACARWIASNEADGYDPGAELAIELRPH